MTKPSKNDIELSPDAWERFERAVDVVAKSPPQPKIKRGKSPDAELADMIEKGDPADMGRIAKKIGNTD